MSLLFIVIFCILCPPLNKRASSTKCLYQHNMFFVKKTCQHRGFSNQNILFKKKCWPKKPYFMRIDLQETISWQHQWMLFLGLSNTSHHFIWRFGINLSLANFILPTNGQRRIKNINLSRQVIFFTFFFIIKAPSFGVMFRCFLLQIGGQNKFGFRFPML